jgi:type IV pilus assembly protein PilA
MKNKTKGFTLIEMMYVIGIITVLAAVALPRYLSYAAKAKITEGISLASGAKANVNTYYGLVAKLPADNLAAGYSSPVTQYVDAVTVTDGNIRIFYNAKSIGLDDDQVQLDLIPTISAEGSIDWKCLPGEEPVPNNYLPPECRA